LSTLNEQLHEHITSASVSMISPRPARMRQVIPAFQVRYADRDLIIPRLGSAKGIQVVPIQVSAHMCFMYWLSAHKEKHYQLEGK
jgi:hypothetical protein